VVGGRHLEWLFQQIQASADAVGQIDWEFSVDSTAVRAHQHAAGARNAPPAPVLRGDAVDELAGEAAWQSLRDRLAEAAQQAKASAVRAAGSSQRSI
jgi:hypothetical protein